MVYATEGVMTVEAGSDTWVIPSRRAVWLPAGIEHAVRTTGRVRMRTLYFRPDFATDLPLACAVLTVSALLRELVLETIRHGMLRAEVPSQGRLARVLVDQIRSTSEVPLALPWPNDPRAKRLAGIIAGDAGNRESLETHARACGASVRTMQRLFRDETGLTFDRWRRQAQLLEALRYLAAGESVTQTALAVGFNSTSAFIAMFRRALGKTPNQYFAAEDA